ncbi:hypothetical protein M9H77_12040 [Catharanthus roseus]|uniref:Uncharacterized protein n=1 Tax=Catharanthus roseus TaxID=4058 RepID=A0ACC0BG99_CATRO|nr:hypothetical protein M9H77_12040 [Catharanthus roseus]
MEKNRQRSKLLEHNHYPVPDSFAAKREINSRNFLDPKGWIFWIRKVVTGTKIRRAWTIARIGELVEFYLKIERMLWKVHRAINFNTMTLLVIDKAKEDEDLRDLSPPPSMAEHTMTDYARL